MEPQEATKPAERRVALFAKGHCLWLLSTQSQVLVSAVFSEGKQSPHMIEAARDEADAQERFRKNLREAPQHNWHVFYRGPVLNG